MWRERRRDARFRGRRRFDFRARKAEIRRRRRRRRREIKRYTPKSTRRARRIGGIIDVTLDLMVDLT